MLKSKGYEIGKVWKVGLNHNSKLMFGVIGLVKINTA